MARTNIMSVLNLTSRTIKIDWKEHNKHDATLSKNHGRELYYAPVPWCSNTQEFSDRRCTIFDVSDGEDKKVVICDIWQDGSGNDGDHVRYSVDDQWHKADSSNRIPGHSDAGGHVTLVVIDNKAEPIKALALDWYRANM